MDDIEATVAAAAGTLRPPDLTHISGRRRSHDSAAPHEGSSVYEEAEEDLSSPSDSDFDELEPGTGGLRPPSARGPLPARLSESSDDRIREREWWFGVKEAMRGHLQHLQAGGAAGPTRPSDPANEGGSPAPGSSASKPRLSDAPYAGTSADELSAFHAISTGYHAHLLRIAPRRVEALTLVQYALRCLGGRWTVERRACVRDELFHIHVPASGPVARKRIDCTDEKEFAAFRALVAAPRADQGTNVLVLPDLSPLVVETLGGLLAIDHRVFSNHIWSARRRPFHAVNRHAFDMRADTSDPAGTAMVEVDTDALMHVSGGGSLRPVEKDRAKERWLRSFREPSSAYSFLTRNFDKWPDALAPPPDIRHDLSTAFQAVSRATVHRVQDKNAAIQVIVILTPSSSWVPEGSSSYSFTTIGATIHCQDLGDPFLQRPPAPFSTKPSPTPSEEDRYCSELESYLAGSPHADPEVPALHWLADKFAAATSQLVQGDARRLTHFRLAQRALSRSGASAEGRDPLLDLQRLRGKSTQRADALATLAARLSSLPPSAAQAAVQAAQARVAQHLAAVAAAQADVSAALARTLTLLQLEESRKSIAQNAMVRRLTLLAFVFVPVSATTSAFGMNVAELLADPPPAWSFVVAALGVSLVMLAVAGADWAANVAAGVAAVVGAGGGGARRGDGAWGGRAGGLALRAVVGAVGGARAVLAPARATLGVLRSLHDEGGAARQRRRVARDAAVLRRMEYRWGQRDEGK